MIPVAEALDRIFALLTPLPAETVPLRAACGRVLARDAVARRDQPPFDASVMDGYAVSDPEPLTGTVLRVVGEAAAGHALDRTIGPGEAARIFTGAPLPQGAVRVIIQENTAREGDLVRILTDPVEDRFVRPAGGDFRRGDRLLSGRRLSPSDLVLLASMNLPTVDVTRRPVVAILTTGDELVPPGAEPDADQIVASNGVGLAALAESLGARARLLPIVADRMDALEQAFALCEGADLVVSSGGASVGDHDLLGSDLSALGVERAFYRVAMRPGKPLFAGTLRGVPMIGLPGNPVSSMVCGYIFMCPALRMLQGLPSVHAPRLQAVLAADLPANGPREHYMRARLADGKIAACDRQDSSLQRVLADADALLVRPPHDPPCPAGSVVAYVPLHQH